MSRILLIQAMPYWNMAFDSINGKYRNDPEKYIFTNNYFGQYYGALPNYQVVDGLFANWPIAKYTRQRFGNLSRLAVGNPCIAKEYFQGTTASTCDRCCGVPMCTCDREDDTYSTYLRAHDDCTPVVARYPEDPDGLGELGGTYEIVYTEQDFHNCTDISQVRSWMEWQDCIEMSTFMCSQRFEHISGLPGFLPIFRKDILPQMQRRASALQKDEYGFFARKAVRDLQAAADDASQFSDSFTKVLKEPALLRGAALDVHSGTTCPPCAIRSSWFDLRFYCASRVLFAISQESTPRPLDAKPKLVTCMPDKSSK